MRVITGTARGRKLITLEGEEITRPTSQSTKEALFSSIQFELEGKRVLDLFAGCGQLGIEALSRGAVFCTFVENNRQAFKVVEQNIKTCNMEDSSSLVFSDALSFLKRKGTFDIAFLDPPYNRGLINECLEALSNHMSDEGVIICDIPAELRNDYLKFCFDNSIRAYIAPKISDIIIRGADDIRLFDTPLLLCRNYGLDFEQRFFKRIFDIVFSVITLIIAMPFMIIPAIAIKLCDGGPVFFKQKRLTIDGKAFDVYKFRSMVVNAEKSGVPMLASENDPRITPVGRFLRKTRLDELPQLLNILKGDMSVVGPRPERPELTEEYKKDMPEFEFRLKVKAGLTGYAQVTGVYDTTPYDKLKMDLMYIENYSMRMDLQIILMTLKTMLFPGKTNEASVDAIMGIDPNSRRKEDK